MRRIDQDIAQRTACIGLLAAASWCAQADTPFELGQITVTARRIVDPALDGTISASALWRFDAPTLAEAVRLVPGVSATFDANGRRNERDIFVRGYGRQQVPLSIDGIRVYLPADNRLDFARFLTSDLAEIQVRKGHASVIDGPGAVGGAINLVTREPVQPLEVRAEVGALLDGDADGDGWQASATIGARREYFFGQVSGSLLDRDGWRLSDDFSPTPIEDGGRRDESSLRDERINVKAGFTPNDSDAYTLSYTTQSGEKSAPLHVRNVPPNPPNSYWRWPWWDLESLYWLSRTAIGDRAELRTRAYVNRFDNALFAFDDATYTTQSAAGRFRSFYDDEARGGSVELGVRLSPAGLTRAAAHFRRDEHTEYNFNRPTSPTFASVEPLQTSVQETASIAVEQSIAVGETIDIIVGASYDQLDQRRAEDFNPMQGLFAYPTGTVDAWNGQVSVDWSLPRGDEIGLSISSRARFPTLFERYSTRFGTAVPNPDLGAERGTNTELRWRRALGDDGRLSAAFFYHDLRDLLQTVIVTAGPPQLTQTRNVGSGETVGVEGAVEGQLAERVRAGAHYTWMSREVEDELLPGLRPTGTPEHQGLAWLEWRPIPALAVTPSFEVLGSRWSDVTGGGYRKVGSVELASLQIEFTLPAGVRVAAGGRNLADRDYSLADGYPEPGRSLYVKASFAFE